MPLPKSPRQIREDKEKKAKLNEISDAENPKYMFQGMSSKLLVKIAMGKLDAKEYARHELENLGLDNKGKWIGYDLAERLWKSKIK